jgi:RNA polymerase sigma-70 factor (ECF subfamily)
VNKHRVLKTLSDYEPLSDFDVVEKIRSGEVALFELLMRRYNNRLYRVAIGILKNGSLAIEAVQDSWLKSYSSLDSFKGPSGFGAWASKICYHVALDSRQKEARFDGVRDTHDEVQLVDKLESKTLGPADDHANYQLRQALECALETLPEIYRMVFILRSTEKMSSKDVAEILDLSVDTIKQRHSRSKAMMREKMERWTEQADMDIYEFDGSRCDAIVASVMKIIL